MLWSRFQLTNDFSVSLSAPTDANPFLPRFCSANFSTFCTCPLYITGFPPHLENLVFCNLLFHSWIMYGICSKNGKTWNFNSKPGIKLSRFTFQDVIYRTKHYLHLYDIYIINTNNDSKPNWPGILLLLFGNNLENTWNLVSPKKWESCNLVISNMTKGSFENHCIAAWVLSTNRSGQLDVCISGMCV